MASTFPTPTMQDLSTHLFPIQLPINGENFKFLVKSETIKAIADNLQHIKDDLAKNLPPKPPNNLIFFELDNGNVLLPEVIFRNDESEPDDNQSNDLNHIDEDEDLIISKTRYDWRATATRSLQNILSDKKKAAINDFVISRKLWSEVSREIAKTSNNTPTSVQFREKFYSLKRGYRKYLMETNKTGNKRPKPFYFETEMEYILRDDPSFKPSVLRSSFGTKEINNNAESVSDHDVDEDDNNETDHGSLESFASTSGSSKKSLKIKKRKTSTDELKDYLAERDEKFMAAMKEMAEKQNKLLEKLIEKL